MLEQATSNKELPLYPLDNRWCGFACPQKEFDPAYQAEITLHHSRKIVRTFLNRFGSTLDAQSYGLNLMIKNWLKQPSDYGTVWHPVFGQLWESLLTGASTEKAVPTLGAALGLHLYERAEIAGEWSIQLESPARLRWGRWLLPSANNFEVVTQPGQTRLKLNAPDQANSYEFNFSSELSSAANNVLESERSDAVRLPEMRYVGNRVTFLNAAALPAGGFDDICSMALAEIQPGVLKRYEEAFELISNFAPVYLNWVLRTIKHLIPVETAEDVMQSGSFVYRPGTIYISYRSPAIALAELMVHEASHQHFHQLAQLGKIDDGSDTNLYYSPVKRQGRPIRAILVTYHAFANMLLFYRLCRKNGFTPVEYCLYNENEILSHITELDSALAKTQALTALGMALWQPLREQIASSG